MTKETKYQYDADDVADISKRLDDVRRQHKAMQLREALESLCVDVRNGEMEPAMIVAGEKFAELLSAANAVGKAGTLTTKLNKAGTLTTKLNKAGTLTTKLKVIPLGEDGTGCVDVSAQVDVKLPRAEQRAAMWIDGKVLTPPQQGSLPLAEVMPLRNPDALREANGD